ncbi:MAG: hypothetical protein WCR58_07445 [Bacteroidales bacterium]|nr:hypothetical protein [Bacteroidales bacterium]MDD3701038.1 hypothetical protein [Bacteroidales bacterium]MDY0369324.1 hypothetical protein [Bacteroidales bacterium]
MKKYPFIIVLLLFLGSMVRLQAQDYIEKSGLPGDNLNLYAVMDMFRESETLEAFERGLNDPEAMINNLDLNGDNLVDYIMVFDYPSEQIHTIVLRVALSETEYQDVAVFTVEKQANGSVIVQLIGDELLYGPNYIVEPAYDETPNPGYAGRPSSTQAVTTQTKVIHTTYYEVARWPVVVFLYRPGYVVWRSSWYWGYYPVYWHPWTPYYWHTYHAYHYGWRNHYLSYYRPWHHKRYVAYQKVYYTEIRHYAPIVQVNINRNYYANTYSKPEKKSEGERIYTQRVSSGTTLPTRAYATRAANQSNSQQSTLKRNERGVSTPAQSSQRVQQVKTADVNKKAPAQQRAPQSTRTARPATQTKQQQTPVNRAASTVKQDSKPATSARQPARSTTNISGKSTDQKSRTQKAVTAKQGTNKETTSVKPAERSNTSGNSTKTNHVSKTANPTKEKATPSKSRKR